MLMFNLYRRQCTLRRNSLLSSISSGRTSIPSASRLCDLVVSIDPQGNKKNEVLAHTSFRAKTCILNSLSFKQATPLLHTCSFHTSNLNYSGDKADSVDVDTTNDIRRSGNDLLERIRRENGTMGKGNLSSADVEGMVSMIRRLGETSTAKLSASVHRENAICAEDLLVYLMEDDVTGRNSLARPPADVCNTVLQLWSCSPVAESGHRALALLDRLGELYAGDLEMQPDTTILNLVLDAFLTSSVVLASSSRPQDIISWQNNCTKDEDKDAESSVESNNSPASAASGGQEVLKFMEDMFRAGSIYVKPNTQSYNSVLMAWFHASLAASSAATTVEEEGDKSCDQDAKLLLNHAVTYAENAEEILDRMIALAMGKDESIQPTFSCFSRCIVAWARIRSLQGVTRAEGVLSKMEILYDKNAIGGKIDENHISSKGVGIRALSATINVLAHFNDKNRYDKYNNKGELELSPLQAAQRAFAIVEKMETHPAYPAPDARVYNTVLHAWSNCGAKSIRRSSRDAKRYMQVETAVNCAEQLLKRMEEKAFANGMPWEKREGHDGNVNGTEKVDVRPTTFSYMTVIDLLSQAQNQKGSADAIEDLLRRMERLSEVDDYPVEVNTITYTRVVDSLSKLRAAARAQAVLQSMVDRCTGSKGQWSERPPSKPNTATFTAVINAWSHSRDPQAAAKAEEVLNLMMDLYQDGVIDAPPDTVTFTAVMNAWVQSGTGVHVAKHAEQVLKRMEELHTSGTFGQHAVKPNTFTYTTVIKAWARSGDKKAADRAEALLERMFHFYTAEGDAAMAPDVVAVTAVIGALSKSRQRGAAKRAQRLLERMEEYSAREGLHQMAPNELSFFLTMLAWVRSSKEDCPSNDVPQKLTSLLQHMQRIHATSQDVSVQPSTRCYNVVINAFAKSTLPDKVLAVQQLLQQMKESFQQGNMEVKPDVFTYTSVINACAFVPPSASQQSKEQALQIALQAWEDLNSSLTTEPPNRVTYLSLFKAYGQLMPNGTDRDEAVAAAFKVCCRDGLLDDAILNAVKHASPVTMAGVAKQENINMDMVHVGTLPQTWSRHAKHVPRSNGKRNSTKF